MENYFDVSQILGVKNPVWKLYGSVDYLNLLCRSLCCYFSQAVVTCPGSMYDSVAATRDLLTTSLRSCHTLYMVCH